MMNQHTVRKLHLLKLHSLGLRVSSLSLTKGNGTPLSIVDRFEHASFPLPLVRLVLRPEPIISSLVAARDQGESRTPTPRL